MRILQNLLFVSCASQEDCNYTWSEWGEDINGNKEWRYGACYERPDGVLRRARVVKETNRKEGFQGSCNVPGNGELEKVACTQTAEQLQFDTTTGCIYNDVDESKSKCSAFSGIDSDAPQWYTIVEKVEPKWNYYGGCFPVGSPRILRVCTQKEIEEMKKASMEAQELKCGYEFAEPICANLGGGKFKKLKTIKKSASVDGCLQEGSNVYATPRECTAEELDFAQDPTGKHTMRGCGYEGHLEGEKFCREDSEGELLWFQNLSANWKHEQHRDPGYFASCPRTTLNGATIVSPGKCSDADTMKDEIIGCGYTFKEDKRCQNREGEWVIHKQLTGVERNQAFGGGCYGQEAVNSWVPFKTNMQTEACEKPKATPENCGVTVAGDKICVKANIFGRPSPKGYYQKITNYDKTKHLSGMSCSTEVGAYVLTEEAAGCTETDPLPNGFR